MLETRGRWSMKKAQEILRLLHFKNAYCEVHLLSNKEMEAIRGTLKARPDFKGREAKKIGKEKQINVLSFPEPKGFPHPESEKKCLGEVYLNRDFANGVGDATLRLLIHGVLHLVGYTHEWKHDTMRMEKIEKILWDRISSSDLMSARPQLRRRSPKKLKTEQ